MGREKNGFTDVTGFVKLLGDDYTVTRTQDPLLKRGIRARTPAYRNRQAQMKSARERNCFRLGSAGVGPGSRTITRTISPSDSLIKVIRLYLHTLVGRTRSTRQMSIIRQPQGRFLSCI